MADKLLESSAISAFCGSMATMLSAGIQIEEAALLLADNRSGSRFADVCNEVYKHTTEGATLTDAMRQTEAFPEYALSMVETGEQAGFLESTLRNLELYYGEEDRMFEKLRTSLGFPLALLLVMAVILAFTAQFVLPIFTDVYKNMAGSLSTVSFTSVETATTIAWVALAITVLCALATFFLWTKARSENGREYILTMFEGVSATKDALYQLALSRFTAALATLISAGVSSEDALEKARATVNHEELTTRLNAAYESMIDIDNPLSLPQALDDNKVLEPLYARMLSVGSRSGRTDETLAEFSLVFFDDAIVQIDRALDRIEPLLAAFLTIAVGLTLVAVMLPLVGIMGSIG